MTNYTRRQFLGVLGAGTVAGTEISQPARTQETPVVEMGNNYFDPIGLHIEPGTTVRFELAAGAHSATAYPKRVPDGAIAFDSGTISQGSYEHTFETPGTYDYYCIPHKSVGMVGRIVVASPGGPAEDSPIPDGGVPTSEAIVEQGAVAIGSNTDGSGRTGSGMMGSGDHGTMGSGDHGTMGPGGPGMMGGRNGGGVGGVPFVGGVLGTLGILGGALYWGLRRESTPSDGGPSAKAVLQNRYARGEIDGEEFRRRRERLESGDDHSSQ